MSTRPISSRGFTLIELLVAMTIGLLLTVVVAQLFVGSRKSYATTDDVSRMQENIRYTHEILHRTIRSISYMSAPNEFAIDTDGLAGVFSGANVALQAADGGGTVSDSFTARYEGSGPVAGIADGTIVDCQGIPVPAKIIVENIFTIALDPTTNAFGLFCRSSLAPAATANVLISPFVLNMQILYGEDTTGDANADHYVAAGSVANTNNVVSMRIGLLFSTPSSNVRSSADATTYNVNGVVLPAFNDNYIRRVTTMTVSLRNRVP